MTAVRLALTAVLAFPLPAPAPAMAPARPEVPAGSAACDTSFYWSGPEGSVAVWPCSDLMRIELAPVEETAIPGVPSGARLILEAAASSLTDGFRDAGLSLAPPAIPAGPDRAVLRLRYGSGRAGGNLPARADIFPEVGQPDRFLGWIDYPRRDRAGPAAVARFRRAGTISIALWSVPSRGAARHQTEARFDWSGVEALAARARTRTARAAAGPQACATPAC